MLFMSVIFFFLDMFTAQPAGRQVVTDLDIAQGCPQTVPYCWDCTIKSGAFYWHNILCNTSPLPLLRLCDALKLFSVERDLTMIMCSKLEMMRREHGVCEAWGKPRRTDIVAECLQEMSLDVPLTYVIYCSLRSRCVISSLAVHRNRLQLPRTFRCGTDSVPNCTDAGHCTP